MVEHRRRNRRHYVQYLQVHRGVLGLASSGRLRGRHGLTLFEVMVAIAIFAIAVLALISVRAFALRSQVKAQQHQQAVALGLSLMSEVEARVTTDFDQTLETPSDPLMTPHDLPAGYHYAAVQTREGPSLQKITLKITWDDRNGHQSYDLWTKFARP